MVPSASTVPLVATIKRALAPGRRPPRLYARFGWLMCWLPSGANAIRVTGPDGKAIRFNPGWTRKSRRELYDVIAAIEAPGTPSLDRAT